MSAWFLDASVLLACEDSDDVNHAEAQRLLAGPGSLATLDLAFYEVNNVAIVAWTDRSAAQRLRSLVAAVAEDGGVVRVDPGLLEVAADLALAHGISAYDASYVAAAAAAGAQLVSCDIRDLVSRGLAKRPGEAVASRPD